MSKDFLLSICIPTYNRAKYLDQAILSIFSQITDDTSGIIELCVSDNASTDYTDSVVNKYIEQNKVAIVYSKNPDNIGADRNYLKVVNISHGKYCWLLGSDDLVKPGAIAEVVAEISRASAIDIFVCNRTACELKSMHPLREDSPVFDSERGGTYNLAVKEELLHYLDRCAGIMGVFSYISSIIFRKSKWDLVTGEEEFIGTAYVHVYKLLGGMRTGLILKRVGKSFVFTRIGQDSFSFDGPINRFLLDLNGYAAISDKLFIDKVVQKHFLDILVREHGFYTVLWIRAKCSGLDWQKVKFALNRINYNRRQLFMIDILRFPVRLLIVFKHAIQKNCFRPIK